MSRMLTLTDAAWASARELAHAGRRADALAILGNLLARAGLPTALAANARRLAARLCADAGRYGRARNHLAAAAKLEPGNADTRFQLGVLFEDDPNGCDHRAARQFRKAARLDRGEALYRAHLGRALVRMNNDRLGVRALKKAVALAPADADVIAVAVDGLREAGKLNAAWKAVCRARFLAPADRDVMHLWERLRFDLARRTQRPTPRPAGRPAVLPFVRLVAATGERRTVRRDTASARPAPHLARLRVRG